MRWPQALSRARLDVWAPGRFSRNGGFRCLQPLPEDRLPKPSSLGRWQQVLADLLKVYGHLMPASEDPHQARDRRRVDR